MNTFAVLLRGINVGPHNRIKMADLRGLLETAGFASVSTYIQTGNVRLSTKGDAESVRKLTEAALRGHGISNPQMAVLPWGRLEELAASKPYEGYGEEWRTLALFLSSPLASPSDWVGEYGVMKVIAAEPDVIFTLAMKEDTPGMKGMDNLERQTKIPATGRFWNVIEEWVQSHP